MGEGRVTDPSLRPRFQLLTSPQGFSRRDWTKPWGTWPEFSVYPIVSRKLDGDLLKTLPTWGIYKICQGDKGRYRKSKRSNLMSNSTSNNSHTYLNFSFNNCSTRTDAVCSWIWHTRWSYTWKIQDFILNNFFSCCFALLPCVWQSLIWFDCVWFCESWARRGSV